MDQSAIVEVGVADVVSVEVLVSTDTPTDEAQDLVLDEITKFKAQLTGLPGLAGEVDLVADRTDPNRQGGELLQFGLDLIPIALESLLILIQQRRDHHRSSGSDTPAPSLTIRVDITSRDGRAQFQLDAQGNEAIPTASALLKELTGSADAGRE